MYTYNAKVDRVIDGDTIVCTVDLGFCIYVKEKFRLSIINAPEISTEEGITAKGVLQQKIEGKNVVLNIDKKDKYGRWLATVFIDTEAGLLENVNKFMLLNGYAVEYGK